MNKHIIIFFFFFNDTATTEIYTLSLHDASSDLKAGIAKPADLKGKNVGIADYSMTALLFVRGLLQHQYGVAPEDIHWYRRRSEHVSIDPPPNVRIDNIGKDQTLDSLLEQGKLDAVAV